MTARAAAPLLAAALLLAAAAEAPAQEAAPEPAPQAGEPAPATEKKEAPPAASSDDVNAYLDAARPRPAGILPNGPVSILDPVLDDLNRIAKDRLGLELGFAYTAAWQRISDGDLDHGEAGDGDITARWRLLGSEDDGWRGLLGALAEGRHDFGENTPRDLGDSVGSLWRTSNTFGVQEFALVQLWWEQHLLDDAVVVTLGKMDPDNYYNTNRFQSDSTAFMSRAFSSNPARTHPSNGLGANAKVKFLGEFYALAGFQDANAVKVAPPFDTWSEHEFFGAAELGWTPALQGLGKGAYRFTAWKVQEREDAGVPSDRGLALSCDQEVGGGFVPFLRAATSAGSVTGVDQFVCGGLGLDGVVGTKKDLTGIGVSWGDPADESLRNQWGGEIFHRFQLSPDVQFTIGWQHIRRPSDVSVDGDDPVNVLEFRVRIAF